MDIQKILRILIYFMIFVIIAASCLIWINDTVARLRPLEEEEARDVVEDEKMKGIYTTPPIRSRISQGGQPDDYEARESNPESTTGLIGKIDGFESVGEKPKNPAKILSELAQPKKVMVGLDEKQLDKQIILAPAEEKTKLDSGQGVPEPGMPLERSGIAMISVPVDYKLFSSQDVWQKFAETYHITYKNDFSKNDMIVLVSMSDFPPGIFSIKEVKKEGGEIKVIYSVNPLLMSAGIEESLRKQYAYAPVPKGTKKVVLEQTI